MENGKDIKLEYIGTLLGKYFDGETTLTEEQQIREFFTYEEDIPAELKYAQAMFGHFAEAACVTGKPAVHPEQTLSGKRQARPAAPAREHRGKRGLKYYLAGAVSAAAVIAATLVLTTNVGNEFGAEQTVYCYIDGEPVTDLDLAFEYSRQAFDRISTAVTSPLPDTLVFEAFGKLEYIAGLGELLKAL